MEIKRNIFESPARMPRAFEQVSTPLDRRQINPNSLVGLQPNDRDVRHAPIPRIGEQK